MGRDTPFFAPIDSEKPSNARAKPLVTSGDSAFSKDNESLECPGTAALSEEASYRGAIHEINDLLGVINVYSELLGIGTLDGEQRKAANTIRDASARAGTAFHELLRLRTIETTTTRCDSLLDATEERVSSIAVSPSPTATTRILVVDDNRDTALAWKTALEMIGYDVRAAYDGPEAIRTARVFKPVVALLDLGLPMMSGYQVARELLHLTEPAKRISLVAVTGYGNEADRKRSDDAGFAKHLVKPVDLNSLISVVQELAG
jgi:CheY-like chemotaxis protein